MPRKFILILILFLIHSCGTSLSLDALVSEQIIFNRSKNATTAFSGTYSFTLDLRKSQVLLDILKGLEGASADLDAFFYNSFHEAGNLISEVRGVTNVKFKHDSMFLHFTISFDFNGLRALNEAISCIRKSKKDHLASIKLDDGRLVREFAVVETLLQHPSGICEEKFTRFELFFKKIKWQTTYVFEDRRVRRPTHGYKELANDKHGIVFEQLLIDMSSGCRHVIYLA